MKLLLGIYSNTWFPIKLLLIPIESILINYLLKIKSHIILSKYINSNYKFLHFLL